MTRKHYIAAAKVLSAQPIDNAAKSNIAAAFAELFANDNPRFDKNKFLKACGL